MDNFEVRWGISAKLCAPENLSLPFKGRAGVGMGLYLMDADPIPHLTSPLKGEEPDKSALLSRGEGNNCPLPLGKKGGMRDDEVLIHPDYAARYIKIIH
jgi:hypothetical protein